MAENIRILIADDEPDIREIVARRLQSKGFEVIEALDGEDASSPLQASAFYLAMPAIDIPKLDDFGVLEYINRNTPHIPLIFLTALDIIEHSVDTLLKVSGPHSTYGSVA